MPSLDEAYRILDLPPGAPEEDVRRAWLELTKVWHPDRFGDDPTLRRRAEEKQKEINEAYETIRVAGPRFRWPGGFPSAQEEEAPPDGWAVRVNGRFIRAADLETILEWLREGQLHGNEDVYDPVRRVWVALSAMPEAEPALRRRAAGRFRIWAFGLIALALVLLLRRPGFGMLLISGSLLVLAIALLYTWAKAVDDAKPPE